MNTYVGYYRVSTRSQERSGLGLESQQASVRSFISDQGHLVGEFTEVESGSTAAREGLRAALACCRKHRATLVIAKLDRLARNVRFISQLMEAGIDFVAVDMPSANKLTLHIIAAIAEHERDLISQRTKSALSAAKRRGTKLGNPRIAEAQAKGAGVRIAHADQFARRTYPVIVALRKAGVTSYAALAAGLNTAAIPTQRSKLWTPAGVRNVVLRASMKKDG
ncbi:resolvase [Stenotrophomonas maltophilia]|nr:resolvase [Stenotrophomonas maltophilia]